MELFKLFGTIGLNGVDEANRDIDSVTGNAENSSSKLGTAFKKIGTVVASVFAVDKIVSFGKEIVSTAATVNAETSAFEQIMGDYSDSAREKLNEVADSTGTMATRMQSHFTSLSAKFKGLGFDVSDATTLAQRGLTLAADAAAFWDVSLDDSSSHLNSFINGSYEGGEAIGLFANDTQMAMYAVQEGIVESTKEWSSLDEATKQATRLEYAENMFELSGATGQATREASQYANVQGNLTEKWRQFKAEIGEPLLQNVVVPAMAKLSEVIDALFEAWDVLNGKVELSNSKFAGLQPVIDKVKDAFNTLKEIFTPVIETISNTISQNIPKWKESFDKVKESLTKLQPVWELIGGVIAGVVAVISGAINGLINALSGMIDWLSGAITIIGGFFDVFLGFFEGDFGRIQKGIQTMSDGIKMALEGIWEAVSGFLQGFVDGFAAFLEGMGVDVDGWLQGISDGFNSFIDWIVTAFNDVKQFFVDVWTGITTFLSDAWETIKNVVQVGIMFIGSLLQAAWDIITLPFQFIWENCKDTIISIWESIKTAVSNAINAVKDVITTVFNAVKDFITTVWNSIKSAIETVVNAVKTTVTNVWNGIKDVTSTVFNAVKDFITTVWNAIKSAIEPIVNGIKTAVTNAWNAIKSATSTAFNAVKSVATTIWNGIKSAITTVVNAVKTTVTNVFNAIKTAISTPLNAAKSTVSSIFDNIKSKIKSAIEGARDIVKNAIDKIKGFFNFSWSLPKLKLPHFSISGKFSLDPPSVPKLAVDWYKKGGILTQPTAFGINPKTGALRVGGEAGDEAVAPIDALLGYVRTAVKEETGDIAYTVQRLIDMLADYFPQILSNMDQAVVLDDGTLVGRIAPKMNMRLNDIQAANARGR